MGISGVPHKSRRGEKRQLVICADAEAVAQEAARRFVSESQAAISGHEEFSVALSGGSTPRRLFKRLAGAEFQHADWKRMRLFWSDERAVPPDHDESNFALARRELLANVPVPPAQVHRMEADGADIEAAAEHYETLIRQHARKGDGGLPSFDLILLGLGADGHTASLFPGAPELQESERLVCATAQAHHGRRRLTFTLPLLNAARVVMFLVTGAEKAAALHQMLAADRSSRIPAARVQPTHGRVVVIADQEAASSKE